MMHSMFLTGSKQEVVTTLCIFGAIHWALGKHSQAGGRLGEGRNNL